MSTIRQKRLAKAIVDNLSVEEPLNKKELLVSAGYSEVTAEASPSVIIEAKGVEKELLAYGFDEETAKAVVGEILVTGQEHNRLRAADMIFDVLGSKAPQRHLNVNVEIETSDALKDLAHGLLKVQRS